jgi:dephospho-CoA kinase
MMILGLTGSIGMGKSTTAQMFRDHNILVHDSDATVHALYAGEAIPLIEAAFPGTTGKCGVDRAALSRQVIGNETAMRQLEKIVHPLVRDKAARFLENAKNAGAKIVVMDNPLLFEMQQDKHVDGIIVVTAPAHIQRQRVLARNDMSEEKLDAILARQYPDEKKRQQADFIIDTSLGLDNAKKSVAAIVAEVQSGRWKKSAVLTETKRD